MMANLFSWRGAVLLAAMAFLTIVLLLLRGPRMDSSNPSQEDDGPENLYCEAAEYDFGALDVTKELERTHVFRIVNNAKREVHIERIRSTCGCTVTDVDRSLLDAGQQARVSATVHWSPRVGRQSVSLFVETREFPVPLPLRLECEVVSGLQLSTDVIAFGALPPGKQEIRTVRILSRSPGRSFRIKGVSTPSGNLSVLDISYGTDGTANIRMAMTGQDSRLDEVVPVFLTTTIDSLPPLKLTATAVHPGCLDVQPRVPVLSFEERRKNAQVRITVETVGPNSQAPLEVLCELPEGILHDTEVAQSTGGSKAARSIVTIKAYHPEGPSHTLSGLVRLSQGTGKLDLPVLIKRE